MEKDWIFSTHRNHWRWSKRGSISEAAAPTAAELFSEVSDGGAPESQAGGERLRFFDAVAEEFEVKKAPVQ